MSEVRGWGAFAGAGAGRRFAPYKRFPEGKTLMPGEFSSPEQMKEAFGSPVRPAARGTAGAHIAELINTMLEKKASGIDLK